MNISFRVLVNILPSPPAASRRFSSSPVVSCRSLLPLTASRRLLLLPAAAAGEYLSVFFLNISLPLSMNVLQLLSFCYEVPASPFGCLSPIAGMNGQRYSLSSEYHRFSFL
jgi:hypothetical protein